MRGGTPFRGAERGGRGRGRLAGAGVEAHRVVGADGALSRVAREVGLGRNREFLAGAEVEVAGVRGLDGDRLHCFLDPVLAAGYLGWIVPGVRVTPIGLACRPPARPRLDRFLAKVARVVDLDRATVVGRRSPRAGSTPRSRRAKTDICAISATCGRGGRGHVAHMSEMAGMACPSSYSRTSIFSLPIVSSVGIVRSTTGFRSERSLLPSAMCVASHAPIAASMGIHRSGPTRTSVHMW